jgi:hypothetical protein
MRVTQSLALLFKTWGNVIDQIASASGHHLALPQRYKARGPRTMRKAISWPAGYGVAEIVNREAGTIAFKS